MLRMPMVMYGCRMWRRIVRLQLLVEWLEWERLLWLPARLPGVACLITEYQ